MKSVMIFTALCVVLGVTSTAAANDGGIAAIKVNDIKVREVQWKDGKEEITKRIANPKLRIVFSGGEAAKLQKILPSQLSVITSIQPEIAKAFNESFKTLGIYSMASQQATSKLITVTCEDAKLEMIPGNKDNKQRVVKTGKTECVISIDGFGKDDPTGDANVDTFTPPVCK